MDKERQAPIAALSLITGIEALNFLGPSVQGGLWPYSTGLTILRWTAWSGLGVAVVSLIA